jgi:hypothetical protein
MNEEYPPKIVIVPSQPSLITPIGLRDWFAGQALVGLMSDSGMRPSSLSEFEHMAMRLYQVADAMLAERAKQEGKS